MDQRITFVTLAVADLDRTRAFYVDGLGWEPEVFVPEEVLMIRMGEKLMLSLWVEAGFESEVGPIRRGEGAVLLLAGSLLVLYTDGLVERRDRDLDDGIRALAAALADLDLQAGPEEVCEHLLAVMAQPGQDDDIAVLALRLEPVGGSQQLG